MQSKKDRWREDLVVASPLRDLVAQDRLLRRVHGATVPARTTAPTVRYATDVSPPRQRAASSSSKTDTKHCFARAAGNRQHCHPSLAHGRGNESRRAGKDAAAPAARSKQPREGDPGIVKGRR